MSKQLTTKHLCPPCVVCSERATIEVSTAGLDRFDGGRGDFIQVAFPELSADQRELILTGTHPACWDSMFDDGDDS